VTARPRCLWCQRVFSPRVTGGSAQRFCRPGHRNAFFGAARKWAVHAVQMGVITADTLKATTASVHAAPSVSQGGPTPAEVGSGGSG
jgi:hypothetical protein